MAYYLLDTDAVIDYLVGITDSVALIQDLNNRGESLCVSAVVVAEIHSSLKPEDLDKADRLLGAFTFLSTSPEAARQAGRWRYEYARRGVTLSTSDVLIAATAHACQAAIVTGNLDDYPMEEVFVLPLPRLRQRERKGMKR